MNYNFPVKVIAFSSRNSKRKELYQNFLVSKIKIL